MFGFYNVLFLAAVLHVLMYEFTYDQPTPLKSDVYSPSRKGVEKQAHAVVCTAAAKLQNVVILKATVIITNNFKKNKCYIVYYVKTRAKIF